MARKGEKLISGTELEAQLAKLKKRIEGVLSFVLFDNTAGEIKDFMIIEGKQTISGGGTAVTFIHPFKTGTVPKVTGTSNNHSCVFALDGDATPTGFTARSKLTADGSAYNSMCTWRATGERG